MRVAVYLRLGRVSNLPTVWTNVLAGATLAGARPAVGRFAVLCGIVSLFYVAGMFLNDAFAYEGRLQPVYCHHEQACAMAAEGNARLTGLPGVVNVTTNGPH